MLLSRLFGNKFLVDERFFHIFSLFFLSSFFFSLSSIERRWNFNFDLSV